MQSLERATQNKTTIMVSHQISHLKEMDNIVVIEAGLITQTGSFNELSKQDGLFSNMLKEKLDGLEVSHA
jgi:ATP-binding cassette subfamily C protein CydD